MGNVCCSAGYTIKDGGTTIDASKEEVAVSFKKVTSIAFKNLDNARLRELNLSGNCNQLTSLPAEIGRLTGLTYLNLNNNQLTSLPVEIGRLTGLKDLRLHGNPLTTPPYEVCEEGITAIRAYSTFLSTRPKPGRPKAQPRPCSQWRQRRLSMGDCPPTMRLWTVTPELPMVRQGCPPTMRLRTVTPDCEQERVVTRTVIKL